MKTQDDLNCEYAEWFESNYEDNLDAFIENDNNIEIVEQFQYVAIQMKPELSNCGNSELVDYMDKNITKIAKKHFKDNITDAHVFELFCESRYESKDEIDIDALYEAQRDK
jgi:hypothetical protein